MKFSRYKHDLDYSYAFGATLCYELYKTDPKRIQRVYLRPSEKYGADLQALVADLEAHKIEVLVSGKPFNILGAKDSCLVITEFKKGAKPRLADQKPHLVLVNPSDAGNLGTIMRSAAAFNFTNIAIIDPATDEYNPKAVRASMGAIFHLNVKHYASFKEYQDAFPDYANYAFMLDKHSQQVSDIILHRPSRDNFSLIFGNEASGLPQNFADICTPVILRQSKLVDSLNLSTAASIAMYLFTLED